MMRLEKKTITTVSYRYVMIEFTVLATARITRNPDDIRP